MSERIILKDDFDKTELDKNLRWFSPPKEWGIHSESSTLIMKPEKKTDFWQKTHYGFQADNGHFLYYEISGDFRLSTKVITKPENRYDQAGLMVRFSSEQWLKTSAEYIPDGNDKLGVVVTNQGYSDWSSQEISLVDTSLFYRITKREKNYYVDYSIDGIDWTQIRMTHLDEETDTIQIGIYACSPQDEGFEAAFDFIKIEKVDNHTKVY